MLVNQLFSPAFVSLPPGVAERSRQLNRRTCPPTLLRSLVVVQSVFTSCSDCSVRLLLAEWVRLDNRLFPVRPS